MRRSKLLWKIVGRIFLFIAFFVILILIKSASWFLKSFDGVGFAAIVYQLASPMKGTGTDVIESYILSCLFPSALLSTVLFVSYCSLNSCLKKLSLDLDIRVRERIYELSLKSRFFLKVTFVLLGICLVRQSILIGIPDYIKSICNVSSLYEEKYIDPQKIPLIFPERKRNLILIYVESMETTFASVEDGGAKPDNYIPGLTQLAKENLNFSDVDGLGGAYPCSGTEWTIAGLLSSLSGVNYKLPVGTNDAGEYQYFLKGLDTLGDILKRSGYQNYFMCGSDASFGGRRDFFEQHGDYRIYDYSSAKEDEIISPNYYEFWGMEDRYLYEYAKRKLKKIAEEGETFNFTMLTVDTHRPNGYICERCENDYPEQYANIISCADRQICMFLDWVKQQEWYENTTVVILGDHCSMKVDFWDDIGDYERRVYNCFLNLPDNVYARQNKNRKFTTLDMFPTILASIGVQIDGERLGLGTNLFSENSTLCEQMGWDMLDRELSLYSDYYNQHFIVGEDKKN